MRRFLFLLACVVSLVPALGWAQALEIISLRHRMADELLPQLQPFVERGGALTGMNDKLFLRASARNQQEIRQLVASLDVPLRRLMISVRQEGEDERVARGGSVAGEVTVRNSRVDAGGTARVYSSSRAGSERIAQQVQTVDGRRAAIRVGESIVVPLTQIVTGPAGTVVSQTLVQRDLGTGFHALPRVSGGRVDIEISPLHDTAGEGPLGVRSERLVTTLSGPLGEWLVLGGSDVAGSAQAGGQSWGSHTAARQRRLLLKVEELF